MALQLFMAAHSNGHAIIFFVMWFLSSFFSSPNLRGRRWMSTILPHIMWPQCEFRMHAWNVVRAARWKCRTQKWHKNRNLDTIAQLRRAISSQLRHVSTIGNNLLNNVSPTCPHNMMNLGPVAAEICWRVWGTPANFNGFRVFAALLQVVGVSQTLRRWTEGATYIRQGGHQHWPTFLVTSDCHSVRVFSVSQHLAKQ